MASESFLGEVSIKEDRREVEMGKEEVEDPLVSCGQSAEAGRQDIRH